MPSRDRPRRAWTRSLRFRLTAWFTGTLAVILFLFAVLLYLGAQHALRAETDAFLISEARSLVSLAGGDLKSGDMSDLTEAITARRSSHLPSRDFLLFDVIYVRLLDRTTHRVLAVSPALAGQAALISSLDAVTSPGFTDAGPSEEQTLRTLTEPVRAGPKRLLLQVAVPWDHNADVLERLGLLLGAALPIILIVAALGGWVLVGRTLHPIQRIVSKAQRLEADALPEELLPAPAETDSEIGQLVATLNAMTTRLRRAFEAQRQFAEAQQRFAADASHELRTPLTILRGEMDLALRRLRSPEAYQATLASGLEEIDRLSRIVEGLSFLARQDASHLQVNAAHVPVDLSPLVVKVLSGFEAQASERQILLHYRTPDSAMFVNGNAVQLQQLIGNLVDNALKYMPAGGSVTVALSGGESAEDGSPQCLLTVTDTGIGIASGDLPHLFERFWQGDPARRSGGSGLGLAICAQIAHLHRGHISVQSEPGQGTTFTLTLPAYISAGQP